MNGFKGDRMTTSLLFAVLTWCCMSPSLAEIYHWKDAQGRSHYSDKKPENSDAEDISQTLAPANVDESYRQTEKLRGTFAGKTEAERKYEQRNAYRAQEARLQRQQRCDKARSYLAALRGPVYFERPDGSTYTISEQEREEKARQYAQKVERYCGNR